MRGISRNTSGMRCWLLRLMYLILIAGWAGVLLVLFSSWQVSRAASGRLYDDPAALPPHRAALVLGCVRELRNGQPNLYFRYRVQAALDLYRSGRVEHLLVSGDNHRHGYDEPSDLKEALMNAGVPEEKITCDYAGFRTLDSVIRAQKVFGLDSFIVVSQPFHNERAIFIAQAHGIQVIGFNARDVAGRAGLRVRLRELLACAAAFVDTRIWNRQPRFLGPPVELGSQTHQK